MAQPMGEKFDLLKFPCLFITRVYNTIDFLVRKTLVRTSANPTKPNDRTYRIKHMGLCWSLLIFCQTKSDSQHRFTNNPCETIFL